MTRNSSSRRSKRGTLRWLAVATQAIVIAALVLGAPASAVASSFIVGGCSTSTLIADIEAANSEIDYPGGDTIQLQGSCTFLPTDAYGGTQFAFPAITTDVIIIGNGARIELASGSTARSLFKVEVGGSLVLSNMILAQVDDQSLYNRGSATVSQVTMTHTDFSAANGPGIYNDTTGVLAVIGSAFDHHTGAAGCCGGAISNKGSLTVSDSTFRYNQGLSAIDSTGTASIYGSSFSDNEHVRLGGAITNDGTMDIHGSTFLNNSAQLDGGAIANDGSLTIDGSYLAGNEALDGGAIRNASTGSLQVVNSTFFQNLARNDFYPCCQGGSGGAIDNHGTASVRFATFAENASGSGADLANPEGTASVGASVFSTPRAGATCAGSVSDLGANVVRDLNSGCPATFTQGDPKLSSPAVHGSGTVTMALRSGSAAVDEAPTAGCPAYDQRGVARPVGTACDAGAFEDQRPAVPGKPAISVGTSPNTGSFTVAWAASTDPDGTPVSYRVLRRDADDAAFGQIGTTTSASYVITGSAEGTIRFEVVADDGNLQSAASSPSDDIVVDTTAPTGPTGTPDRAPDANGWYLDTVTVTFSGSTDPVLADGSAGSGVASTTAPQTVSTSGSHDVAGTATDAAGNVAGATTVTVSVDADPPTVAFDSCPSTVILKRAASVSWSASDAESGLASAASGQIPVDTSIIGTRTLAASATDNVGHTATATCIVQVVFAFKGFNAPVGNPPAWNKVSAGGTVLVSFGLGGAQGLSIFASGYPMSAQIDCGSTASLTLGTPTVGTAPALLYGGGRYIYQWQTDKSWAGTCRQFIFELIDGTFHRANFTFK